MAGLTLFQYSRGNSFLHKLDPRWKIAILFALCITVFIAEIPGLVILFTAVTAVAAASRNSPGLIMKHLVPFFVLGSVIFISALFVTPGSRPLIPGVPVITLEGAAEGLLGAGRLLVAAIMGILYFTTTSFIQIRDTFTRFLRWIPGIPEEKAGFMLGLTLTFVPALFLIHSRLADSRRSRSVSTGRKPLRRAYYSAMPLLRNALRHAEHVTEAVESRGFGDKRTPSRLKSEKRDIITCAAALLLCGLSLGCDRIIAAMAPQLHTYL